MKVGLADREENPRIRTKRNRLEPETDADYFKLVEMFRAGEIDVAEYHTLCLEFFRPLIERGEFDAIIEEANQATEPEVELLRRHVDECRYTVIFYRVDEGTVHPPHHHHNVASTQIVVSGKIRIREYDRVSRTDEGKLVLRLVTDTILNRGEHFQASEWKKNVHWFQAVDGPAIIFNTNARGYETKTFDSDEGQFGRRYIDPTDFRENQLTYCDEFGVDEAQKRFQGKSLDDFPVLINES